MGHPAAKTQNPHPGSESKSPPFREGREKGWGTRRLNSSGKARLDNGSIILYIQFILK
jgi:hypothetical protein